MISTILQYSTIDFKFLDVNLCQLSKASDEIIIPMCDHLFNGEPENEDLMQKSYDIIKKYPKATLYTFEWMGPQSNTRYYNNVCRKLGTDIAKNDWLFFVDTDEIITDEFAEWFETVKDTDNMYWLTCYWYWREAIYRAKKVEAAGLLIKKKYCNWNIDLHDERQQLFNNTCIHGWYENSYILDKNGKPMLHHYSWVRNKEEMIKKVINWSHNADKKNWVALVEEEFSRPFNGRDFLHGYEYEIVKNEFNIK